LQIENVDVCLSFLAARGVNVQGLSAEGKKIAVVIGDISASKGFVVM
jgi:hypothetical protein